MSKFILAAALACLAAAPAAANYSLPAHASVPSVSVQKPKVANLPAIFVLEDAPMPFAMANLVVNGSFETGDFAGWEQVNDTSFTFVTSDLAAGGPTDGIFHAAFGPTDPSGGGIVQTIATTPGAFYALSFDLANLGGTPNAFGVFWDNNFVALQFDVPTFDYQTVLGELVATSSSTTLGFIFYNEPSFFLLDNISLTAVPEPASWAMLIVGFGFVGHTLRRRRAAIA